VQSLTINDVCTFIPNQLRDCLAAVATHPRLTSLQLYKSDRFHFYAQTMADFLAMPSNITSLTISQYPTSLFKGICDLDVAVLAQGLLRNRRVTHLDLSHNAIGDQGVATLVQAMSVHSCVTSLRLRACEFHSNGMSALAGYVRSNKNLSSLNMHCYSQSLSGFRDLVDAIKGNPSLSYVQLHDAGACNDPDIFSELLQTFAQLHPTKVETERIQFGIRRMRILLNVCDDKKIMVTLKFFMRALGGLRPPNPPWGAVLSNL